MSYTYPSSYTDADRTALYEAYGYDYEAVQEAIENDTLIDGVSEADAIFYILENTSDLSWLDPDAIDLDDSNANALQNFTDDNRDSQAANDLEAYLEAEGYAVDDLNDAIRIIQDNADILDGSTDDEVMNLVEYFKNTNPYIYLLLYVMFELGPNIEEAAEVVIDNIEDVVDDIADDIDDMDGLTDQDDGGELQALQQNVSMKNQVLSAYQEVLDLLNEIVESMLETSSSGISRTERADSTIIGNIG